MATRLGEYAVYGELRNNTNYTTHGVIVLRGEEDDRGTVLRLDLTGDCDLDLKGRTFRFRPREADETGPIFRREDFPGFQDRQVGPTATMTARGWVRAMPCGAEEFVRRTQLGEPPPTEWARHLYMEWYGQNGRVVVEMAGPIIEECVRQPKGEDDEGEWAPLPHLAPPPDPAEQSAGPEITLLRLEDGIAHTKIFRPGEAQLSDAFAADDLQASLDRETAAIDRDIRDGDVSAADEDIAEADLMDWCIDRGEEQPVGSLLRTQDPSALPAGDALDDRAVELQLKLLLAELALVGVALDVCEHFSPRDCYRFLRDSILPECGVFKELIGTGWVQHVSTHESCPQCETKFEAEYKRVDADQSPSQDL
jgi:hypothetical protein